MMIFLFRVVIIAIVYLVLGRFGIFFAIPSGYSSPIFPAAGFAMAIILQARSSAWLGILLGSFMLNVSIPWEKGSLDLLNAVDSIWDCFGRDASSIFWSLVN
jgi:hypothetical protein